jgi:hypothetical protein
MPEAAIYMLATAANAIDREADRYLREIELLAEHEAAKRGSYIVEDCDVESALSFIDSREPVDVTPRLRLPRHSTTEEPDHV